MPNPSRQKGDRFERACVDALRAEGVPAKRTPLSGAVEGFTGDLIVEVCGREEEIECKTRARGWLDLFNWLKHDKHPPFALFIKADRTDTLVVMDLPTFIRLSKGIL